eukprot:scpid101461/ scgid6446/ 
MQQLRGEPLLWLSEEENKDALEDDEDVIKLPEGQYGHTRASVAYINDFKESAQESGETTPPFLSRLLQLAGTAIPNLSEKARRERVFVRSVRDQRLKEELQVYGFIKEESSTARTYEEILSKATRLESCWRAAENRRTGQQSANILRTDSTVEALRSQIEELTDQVAALRSPSARAPQARRQLVLWVTDPQRRLA